MRQAAWAGLLSLGLLLAASSAAMRAGEPPGEKPAAGASTTLTEPQGPPADNRRCFVCHANYDFNEEKLALGHANAGVGCVQCHGESSRHSTDEDGLTPPDRMFPKAHIRFNCLGCHDWVQLVARDKTRIPREDLPEKPDHAAVLAGTAKDKKLCTDCHGDHRLSHRTRTWDKRSGRLLYRDGTPAMLSPPSAPK